MAATILYITTDRHSAERLASVLHNFTPPLTISWTGEESAVVPWLREKQRAAVVIVNATLQSQSWNALVRQVRSAGLTVPIIVVGSELVGPMTALRAGADYFVADHSLLADLPEFVGRAVRRAQEREALETQVVSARAESQTAQSERAAAIQQGNSTKQLRVSASMDTTTKERLEQEVRKAEASANENAQRCNSALELLRRAKADFQATLDQERAHRERDLAAALDEASTAGAPSNSSWPRPRRRCCTPNSTPTSNGSLRRRPRIAKASSRGN